METSCELVAWRIFQTKISRWKLNIAKYFGKLHWVRSFSVHPPVRWWTGQAGMRRERVWLTWRLIISGQFLCQNTHVGEETRINTPKLSFFIFYILLLFDEFFCRPSRVVNAERELKENFCVSKKNQFRLARKRPWSLNDQIINCCSGADSSSLLSHISW